MKKIIMIAAPVILILAVVGFMFLKPKPPPPDEKKLAKEHGITYTIKEPFVVNLADTDARRFAKVGVALGVSKLSMALVPADAHSEKAPPLEMEPEIRDIIIAALQEKTGEELSHKKGRDEVKETIIKDVNKHTELKLVDVYYTEFAIQ